MADSRGVMAPMTKSSGFIRFMVTRTVLLIIISSMCDFRGALAARQAAPVPKSPGLLNLTTSSRSLLSARSAMNAREVDDKDAGFVHTLCRYHDFYHHLNHHLEWCRKFLECWHENQCFFEDDCRDPDGFDPGVKKKHNVFLSGRGQTRRMLRSTKKNKKKKKNQWKKKDWKWIRKRKNGKRTKYGQCSRPEPPCSYEEQMELLQFVKDRELTCDEVKEIAHKCNTLTDELEYTREHLVQCGRDHRHRKIWNENFKKYGWKAKEDDWGKKRDYYDDMFLPLDDI